MEVFSDMNQRYYDYLQSNQWAAIKAKRLYRSSYQCDVCGSKYRVQIHHLTYERIFSESLDDLICLCRDHHRIAEEALTQGVLTRTGTPKELRATTVKLLRLAGR